MKEIELARLKDVWMEGRLFEARKDENTDEKDAEESFKRALEKYNNTVYKEKPMAFTENDMDAAYFVGVFNSSGIDGLHKETIRIKQLGIMPHEFIGLLRPSGVKL